MVKEILKRAAALIVLKVTGIIAAGSIVGAKLWQSAAVAAFVGIVEVAESLARVFVQNGRLSANDIDKAFDKAAPEND